MMVPRPEVVAISVDLPARGMPRRGRRLAVHPLSRLSRARSTRSSASSTSATCSRRCTSAAVDNVVIADLLRKPYFVPETKDLGALLAEFRRRTSTWRSSSTSTASMQGIVTLEDLLEEIVGEIEDEYDLPDESFEQVDDRTIRVHGTFPIDDFNERFEVGMPHEDYHTLAGFVFGAARPRARGRRRGRLERAQVRRHRRRRHADREAPGRVPARGEGGGRRRRPPDAPARLRGGRGASVVAGATRDPAARAPRARSRRAAGRRADGEEAARASSGLETDRRRARVPAAPLRAGRARASGSSSSSARTRR